MDGATPSFDSQPTWRDPAWSEAGAIQIPVLREIVPLLYSECLDQAALSACVICRDAPCLTTAMRGSKMTVSQINQAPTASNRMTDLNSIKSVKKLKRDIVHQLPYAPNDRASKQYLLSLDIGDLVHIYDFWQQRLIPNRPREVLVRSKVRNSALYLRNKSLIGSLLQRVRDGLDISGHLSRKAYHATFDLKAFKEFGSFDSFRDEMLICEGFYHLHLKAFPERTDVVLIVHVTSDKLEVIQVAQHSLFDNNAEAVAEYRSYVTDFVRSRMPQGGVLVGGAGGGMQNLAGSSIESTFKQIEIRKILQNVEITHAGIEPYVKQLYFTLHSRNPQYVKPEWRLAGRRLTIYDKKNYEEFAGDCLRYVFRNAIG